MSANRTRGRCPYCGKALRYSGTSNVMDWEKKWNAVAVRFICKDGHMVLLLPAKPVLEAEEAARVEAIERPYYGDVCFNEGEPDPVAELLRPEWEREPTWGGVQGEDGQ